MGSERIPETEFRKRVEESRQHNKTRKDVWKQFKAPNLTNAQREQKRQEGNIIFEKRHFEELLDKYADYGFKKNCTLECRKEIATQVDKYGTIMNQTVFRGQRPTRKLNVAGTSEKTIDSNVPFFSVSEKKLNAFGKNAENTCCDFKIHLINAKGLRLKDVTFGKPNHNWKLFVEEAEVLVLGGGTFYQNEKLTVPGFHDLGNGDYEAWYTHGKGKWSSGTRNSRFRKGTRKQRR